MRIIKRCSLGKPDIDLMASRKNRKARRFIDKKKNLFKTELKNFKLGWINAPHSLYHKVIPYLYNEYQKHQFNLICLIPANNVRTSYWQKYIEPNNIFWNSKGFMYWYPYDKPIKFLKNGKHILNKNGRPEHAHNAYLALIILQRNKVKYFRNKVLQWYN